MSHFTGDTVVLTSNARYELSQTSLTNMLKMTLPSKECKSKFCATTGPQWASLREWEVIERGTVTISVQRERERERLKMKCSLNYSVTSKQIH